MYEDNDTTRLMKTRFAVAWLKQPDNPFAAARELEPDRPGAQYWISTHWIHDEFVLSERARIYAENGAVSRVPTKEDFALTIYQYKAKDDATQLAYYKFFAELMGYTGKRDGEGVPGVNVNILNAPGARIMPVPVAASDEEWEIRATEHAAQLMARHG